jgi:hypothetical protein
VPKQLRYTSFKPGELEQRLREFAPQSAGTIPLTNGRGNGSLCKSHAFAVAFPDGKSGTCCYERKGPSWHEFRYAYADGVNMPRQLFMERLGNDVGSIERKGGEMAQACYLEAMRAERDNYFRRASEPSDGNRKKRPERYGMKAQRAKEIAGLYALCRMWNGSLAPVGTLYEEIEKANQAWRETGDAKLVVACCNRLDRCWDVPRYNTLYAEFDLREASERKEATQT